MTTKHPLTELSSAVANWGHSDLYYKGTQGDQSMTDDQRIDMVEDQIEHIIELCKTYVEGDQLEDVGNIRALYEEYGEWIDSYNGVDNSEQNYTVMWAPDLTQV